MTTQRANYLRRAIPRLREQRCPHCRRATLVTDQIDITPFAGAKREYAPGRTTCPRCGYDATGDR